MEKEITFTALATSPLGHRAKNGQLAACIGLAPSNGELIPAQDIDFNPQSPQGHEHACSHRCELGERQITIKRGADGFDGLYWRSASASAASAAFIEEFEAIRDVRPCGKLLVIASAQGLDFAHWTEAGYAMLDFKEPPVVEFGLQKAGALQMSRQYTVPAWMAQADPNQGYGQGAWNTHPLTSAAASDLGVVSNKVFSDFRQAVSSQAEAAGLFHAPFFVRFALRLQDGSRILPSPPVLMLPSLLPPLLKAEITASQDKEEASLAIDASACSYFSLRCRVSSLQKKNFGPYVTAIDIFITECVPTYAETQPADGAIVSYSTLIKDRNLSLPAVRGRKPQESASQRYFAGSWSEQNDDYSDRFLSESDLSAKTWSITPNLSLMSSLLALKDFRLIASIPIQESANYAEFQDLNLCSTSTESIRKLPTLDADESDLMRRISPNILAGENGLMAAGGEIRQPSPWCLASTTAFVGNWLDPAFLPVELTSYSNGISDGGYVTAVCDPGSSPRHSLMDAFPHYIFVPDPDAYRIEVRQGGNAWSLPLRKHPSLCGAYWLGDLESASIPQPQGLPQLFNKSTPPAIASNSVYAAAGTLPFGMVRQAQLGGGEIRHIFPAFRSMSQGQFGQFPHYVFTSEGIWALPTSLSGTVVKISEHAAISAAIAGACIAYCTDGGAWLLAGCQSECISTEMEGAGDPWLLGCEEVKSMLESEGFGSTPSFAQALKNGRLHCKGDALYLSCGEKAYVYSLTDKKWGMACQGDKAFVLTRPIKIDENSGRKKVVSALLTGPLSVKDTKIALLGSDNLTNWRLLGSARDTCATSLRGTGARYISIAASAKLAHGMTLSGVHLKYEA